jgi:exopolysaccharide biosynthesis polyprenyl glycosylphosphotransferase
MAASGFWQRLSASISSSQERAKGQAGGAVRGLQGRVKLQMAMDAITVAVSAGLATLYRIRMSPLASARAFWHGTLIQHRSMGILLVLLCFFILSLILTSQRLNLYSSVKLSDIFQEQRLSVEACLTSGLLLTGVLYLIHANDIPRTIVLVTIGLVTLLLSARRLIGRMLLYRNFKRGVGTRNVLIVGTGPEAVALRRYLDSMSHLGYRFKGFIEGPDAGSKPKSSPSDVVGTLDTLFQQVRRLFVDEIFFTTACERAVVQEVLEKARIYSVDLRMVPEMFDGFTYNTPIEFVGHFPTIPLHRGQAPEVALFFKRWFDIVLSILVLVLFSPALLLIAAAIKLDSPGPVFYFSNRIGKKGRVFRCIKFRTMVPDADARRDELAQMNERDGVLFKVAKDPRITRLGRFLRKYSLDEFPQFFNVLRGDMSIVGPRPPIGSEVREYKLSYLRRLDVTPGITGLWQVQARQDPSFDSYISLDVTYIENWSIWLDFQILLRTIGAVLAGTGT